MNPQRIPDVEYDVKARVVAPSFKAAQVHNRHIRAESQLLLGDFSLVA